MALQPSALQLGSVLVVGAFGSLRTSCGCWFLSVEGSSFPVGEDGSFDGVDAPGGGGGVGSLAGDLGDGVGVGFLGADLVRRSGLPWW